MAGFETSQALHELYNIAIQSLEELKLNATASEFAVFCDEMEQVTVDTMRNHSKNRRRMEIAHSDQYYNHYQVPEHLYHQPQPTFKKPLPFDRISKNPQVSMRSNKAQKVFQNVSMNQNVKQHKKLSSISEKNEVIIGVPPGFKHGPGNDFTSSEENSEDEENSERQINYEMSKKKHNNVSKKKPPTMEMNKRKNPSSKNESTLETEKSRRKPSLGKNDSAVDKPIASTNNKKTKRHSDLNKFEEINADFMVKNWSLSLKNKHLLITGHQYNRALTLVVTDFVSSPITSAKKIQGKFVVKTKDTTYLLIESKINDDPNIPEKVKKFCKNEFPHRWRQCLTLWLQLNQTTEESENEAPEPQMTEMKIPESKKPKKAPKRKKNESKAPPQKKNEKKAVDQQKNEPENNGKSIFQKVMADDSLDAGNCMTPSALLNSIKKSNVSVAIHTPPSNFMRDLQSTSVFEQSAAKSSDTKKKLNSKVVERVTKNIEKKGNVPVQNIEPHVLCEKVDFNKIFPQVVETSTFCSDSELSSISD